MLVALRKDYVEIASSTVVVNHNQVTAGRNPLLHMDFHMIAVVVGITISHMGFMLIDLLHRDFIITKNKQTEVAVKINMEATKQVLNIIELNLLGPAGYTATATDTDHCLAIIGITSLGIKKELLILVAVHHNFIIIGLEVAHLHITILLEDCKVKPIASHHTLLHIRFHLHHHHKGLNVV